MKKIKCPDCGAEYLPAEIFYPDEFFGKPNSIEKDVYGKLLFFNGNDMNLTETYRCDYCGEWITGDYIKVENDNRYCENCFKHMELGEEEN